MKCDGTISCVETLVGMLGLQRTVLLLTHLAWKSPIETSYCGECDVTMICVEVVMECNS